MLRKLLSNYGMILVLIALCVLFSLLTLKEQPYTGGTAVVQMADKISSALKKQILFFLSAR